MANVYIFASAVFVLFGVVSIGLAENPEETGSYLEGDIVSITPSLLIGTTRAGILGDRFRWPNGVVPYEFARGYPSNLQTLFRRAIDHISQRTCIKFTPRTSERDYISVMSGNGCYSHVGRIGGKQDVSLPSSCYSLGVFVHEIIHALGYLHEHSRTDRDDYVNIKFENIKSGLAYNFDKYGANRISPFGVGYDYNSVMHYSRNAFSVDGRKDTIVPKNSNAEIGQRRGMSAGDVAKINNMYCKNTRGNSNHGTLQLREDSGNLVLF